MRLSYLERNTTGEGRILPTSFSHRRPPEDLAGAGQAQYTSPDGLIDYHSSPTDKASTVIAGGTLLVSELERPYSLHRRHPPRLSRAGRYRSNRGRESEGGETEIEQFGRKVRDILDAEKPAHTEYAVRITPAAGRPGPRFMQIGEHSSIGLDTTVA